MSLRRRLTLATAVAVALAIGLACATAYLVVRAELHGQIDDQLTGQAERLAELPANLRAAGQKLPPALVRQPTPGQGGPLGYIQVLDRAGRPRATPPGSDYRLPVDAIDRAVAVGRQATPLRKVEQDGVRLRLITVPLPAEIGGAIQLARPLDGTEEVLRRLALILLAVTAGGIVLAALLGRLVTRRVIAPLREVADAAGHIAETDDLGRRLAVRSNDEVGELAARFNAMLDRLEGSRTELSASVDAQRQLVADASHELRTPITSLRTNIEVLVEGQELDPVSRSELLGDLADQVEELGELVVDVIELARGDAQPPARHAVRLDELAEETLTRVRRHHPQVRFTLTATPVHVEADATRLTRAVGNLLENAAKHSDRVELSVGLDGVSVRDHGPGIATADLPHLFDRFYRGETARGLPGTGLGLAIVRQVAESHGGTVSAENAEGGGARFALAIRGQRVSMTA